MKDGKTARRKYTRRTEEERIRDLEARIEELELKQASKRKKTDPVLREIPKLQRRLRKFAQFALDHDRPDLANSTTAFAAGLERVLRTEAELPVRDAPSEDDDPTADER